MKYLYSAKTEKVLLVCVFLFMLLCNIFTPFIADDYVYMFNFANGEPLSSVGDIIPSMAAHRTLLNGRVVAHGFVQLFMLMPKMVFNLVNAALFAFLLLMMQRIVEPGRKNNLSLFLLFCALWLFLPAFGEVCLWFDGSVNYLWAMTANLLFLLAYVKIYVSGESSLPLWAKLLLIPLALAAGAFQESMAVGTFMVCLMLLLLCRFYKKTRPGIFWAALLAVHFAGICFMAFQPAELSVKSAGADFIFLYRSTVTMLEHFIDMWLPATVYVVALCLCILGKKDRDRIILSAVFALAFLAANVVMALAVIYPTRCAAPAMLFILLADAILLRELWPDYKKLLCCALAVLVLFSLFWGVFGFVDILSTAAQFKSNENRIIQGSLNGETEFLLPAGHGATKYSVAYEMFFPSHEAWSNDYVSRYYGVDSIAGYDHYTEFMKLAKAPER